MVEGSSFNVDGPRIMEPVEKVQSLELRNRVQLDCSGFAHLTGDGHPH